MSSTGPTTLTSAAPGRPPETPDENVQLVPPEDVSELLLTEARAARSAAYAPSIRTPASPRAEPISLTVDEAGAYIVQDVLGAVYGTGRTPEEARVDFDAALGDHLVFLRVHRDHLEPRLETQLVALEKLFPGR